MKPEFDEVEVERAGNHRLMKVTVQELIGKFRSKSDIYDYLRYKQKLFLPTYGEAKLSNQLELLIYNHLLCFVGYLRDLIAGRKPALLQKEVAIT